VPTIEFDGWPNHAEKIKPKWVTKEIADKAMEKHHVVAKTCPIGEDNDACVYVNYLES